MLLACLIPQPTGTPRPHQWLLIGVQACRLPPLKPTPLLLGGPAFRSPGVTRFKPIPQPTGTPTTHQCLLMHVQACCLPALKPTPLLLGGPACRSPGVTRFKPIPQPTGTPRPHQWLLMGVQACRLPALKPLKRLKALKTRKTFKTVQNFSERPTAQAKAAPRPHPPLLLGGPACRSPGVTRFKPFKRLNILVACLIPQPTGTPRLLLMGVQACRLPALKPLKPLKP